jgi:fluoride exporter
MNIEQMLLVSVGAIIGANARFWIMNWSVQRLGVDFPYGTLIINISGSFLLGLFISIITERLIVDPRVRLLITVGILGSFTTFSTYTYESIAMMLRGQWMLGAFNLFGSAFLGGAAVIAGVWVGRSV